MALASQRREWYLASMQAHTAGRHSDPSPKPEAHPGPGRAARALAVAALALAATALVAAAWLARSPRPQRHFTEVQIPTPEGVVVAQLSPPRRRDAPWVVLVHGSRRQGQDHRLYRELRTRVSAEAGVLAIDLLGFGRSALTAGAELHHPLDRSAEVLAALDWLSREYAVGDDRMVLVGHSFGAAQVLLAAHSRPVALVAAIAPYDWDAVLDDPLAPTTLAASIGRRLRVRVDPGRVAAELPALAAVSLFASCPRVPIVLLGGSREPADGLFRHRERIPPSCRDGVRWVTIPLADHMYGTEGGSLPRPLRRLASRLMIDRLARRLNQLLPD